MFRGPSRRLICGVAAIVVVLSSTSSRATEGTPDVGYRRMEEAAKHIAAHVASKLKEQRETALIVGDFTAPPRLKASGGAGVRQLVIDALKSERIDVRDGARIQLVGEFSNTNEEDPRFEGEIGLQVRAKLLDQNDSELNRFRIQVFGAAVLQITGGTAELPPNAPVAERRQRQNDRLRTPQASLIGTETRAAEDSPYGVEILVKQGADIVARQPELVAGRSFVALHRNEEYVARLHNRSQLDAAVLLTIDGLSMFAFSTEGNFGSQVIVPAGTSVDVTGWYFAATDTRAFKLTSYPDSAAGSKGIPTASVGVVTATFAATWDPSESPPQDEVAARSADTATGIGERTGQSWTSVNRVIGRPRSVVSVRYNREL